MGRLEGGAPKRGAALQPLFSSIRKSYLGSHFIKVTLQMNNELY